MATAFRLDDALGERLGRLAQQRDRSPEAVLEEAVTRYLEQEELRASFVRDAEDAWAEYRRTGLHLTGDELRGWLGSWGKQSESQGPECHV